MTHSVQSIEPPKNRMISAAVNRGSTAILLDACQLPGRARHGVIRYRLLTRHNGKTCQWLGERGLCVRRLGCARISARSGVEASWEGRKRGGCADAEERLGLWGSGGRNVKRSLRGVSSMFDSGKWTLRGVHLWEFTGSKDEVRTR